MITIASTLKKAICLLLGTTLALNAKAQTVTYFHNDISGSPMMATDADGNLVWKENYRPYGEKLNKQPASSGNKIGFQGRAFDDATGLSFMGARYYDPVVGRFMGIDPEDVNVSDVHSFSRYAFANNNPYKYVDPDGRNAAVAITGIGILLIGAVYYATQPAQRQQEMKASLGQLLDAIMSTGKSAPSTVAQSDTPTVTVGGAAPPPNEGDGGKHGRPEHDKAIRDRVDTLQNREDVRNIRMNQQQTNVNGQRVGTNKPDLQWDQFNKDTGQWEHHNVEWDYRQTSSQNHQQVIKANDPQAINEFNMLK